MFQETDNIWMLYKIGVLVFGGTLIFIVALINSKKALAYLDRKFEDRAEWLVKELDALFIEFNKKTALILIYAGTLGVGFIVFVLLLPNFHNPYRRKHTLLPKI